MRAVKEVHAYAIYSLLICFRHVTIASGLSADERTPTDQIRLAYLDAVHNAYAIIRLQHPDQMGSPTILRTNQSGGLSPSDDVPVILLHLPKPQWSQQAYLERPPQNSGYPEFCFTKPQQRGDSDSAACGSRRCLQDIRHPVSRERHTAARAA